MIMMLSPFRVKFQQKLQQKPPKDELKPTGTWPTLQNVEQLYLKFRRGTHVTTPKRASMIFLIGKSEMFKLAAL